MLIDVKLARLSLFKRQTKTSALRTTAAASITVLIDKVATIVHVIRDTTLLEANVKVCNATHFKWCSTPHCPRLVYLGSFLSTSHFDSTVEFR